MLRAWKRVLDGHKLAMVIVCVGIVFTRCISFAGTSWSKLQTVWTIQNVTTAKSAAMAVIYNGKRRVWILTLGPCMAGHTSILPACNAG